jgi:hypothetical protein
VPSQAEPNSLEHCSPGREINHSLPRRLIEKWICLGGVQNTEGLETIGEIFSAPLASEHVAEPTHTS